MRDVGHVLHGGSLLAGRVLSPLRRRHSEPSQKGARKVSGRRVSKRLCDFAYGRNGPAQHLHREVSPNLVQFRFKRGAFLAQKSMQGFSMHKHQLCDLFDSARFLHKQHFDQTMQMLEPRYAVNVSL